MVELPEKRKTMLAQCATCILIHPVRFNLVAHISARQNAKFSTISERQSPGPNPVSASSLRMAISGSNNAVDYLRSMKCCKRVHFADLRGRNVRRRHLRPPGL